MPFRDGKREQFFGKDYPIAWFDHIRTGSLLPFEKGVVTYYRTFEERWEGDFYKIPTRPLTLSLGRGILTFSYDPASPPAFRGEGLLAEELAGRADVVSIFTPPFERDAFIKGQMRVSLAVESDCRDTSFYVRISIKKQAYTYVLRHDITSLCHQLGDYTAGDVVELSFCFDEYAFLVKEGECLQIDISATDQSTYVCHTNKKGAYALQANTVKANNKIYLDRSWLILPVEEK